jgi:glycosyltransferase involved in cell wall biosynthesis
MISVCMAVFNGEKYIHEQLESILNQLGPNDEVVVSDDGSIDKTLSIINEFNDSRIRIFHHKQNPKLKQGHKKAAKNFENALKFAGGDYIFLSDQDDIWLSEKIHTIMPFLREDTLVLSDAFIVNETHERQGRLSRHRPYHKGFFRNLYKSGYVGCTCAFTKKIKEYALPFPDAVIGHDYWIGLLAELKFSVVYLDIPLLLYRRHLNTISTTGEESSSPFLYKIHYRTVLLFETLKRILTKK